MTTRPGPGRTLRPATHRDAAALADLERRTNTVALAHVFDPDEHRFPLQETHDRWERLVSDLATTVTVAQEATTGRLVGVVSSGEDRVGHLVVEPAWWGTGLAVDLLDGAVGALRAAGRPRVELTCLVANGRARRFYAKHGWVEQGSAGRAPWPPYPRQLTCTLDLRPPRGARGARVTA